MATPTTDDATPFPSRPRLHSHSPALAHDTPPELRLLEGVWRSLRRSAPPDSPAAAAAAGARPVQKDAKGKGREQRSSWAGPKEAASTHASRRVADKENGGRPPWYADDDQEPVWSSKAAPPAASRKGHRGSSPSKPLREPLGPSRPSSTNMPPAASARSLYHQPRQPTSIAAASSASRPGSTTRTVSHASTHKTAGSPPTVHFAVGSSSADGHHAPRSPPKRKTSSSSTSKHPAKPMQGRSPDQPEQSASRPLAVRTEDARTTSRIPSSSSSTAFRPSHLHARLHDFPHLQPAPPGPSYHQPPLQEPLLDEHSLAAATAASRSASVASSSAGMRHPAEHPLATLHLAPSSQALKHGHVAVLPASASDEGSCVILWLRGETWALSDDGQKLCYWTAVAPQDSRALPSWAPDRRWVIPASHPHRAVERDEAKHQRRFRFLAHWIAGERARGLTASVNLAPPAYPLGTRLVVHADPPRPSFTLHLPTSSKADTLTAHYAPSSGTVTLERRTEGLWTRRVVCIDDDDDAGEALDGRERDAWALVSRCVGARLGQRVWSAVASG